MKNKNFNAEVGLNFRGFVDTEYVIDLEIESRHHNVMGFVHGGVLCSLLDTAMARAFFYSGFEEKRTGATLEMKVNFLKSSTTGKITAYGTLVNSTKQTAYVEGRIENEAGQLLAKASSTMMLFEQIISENEPNLCKQPKGADL